MSLRVSSALFFVALLTAACAQEPTLYVSVNRHSIDGRVDRAILTARTQDGWGRPGEGTVRLSAAVGAFVEGDEVPLVEGVATATYQCDPRADLACNGDIPLAAGWLGLSDHVTVKVGPIVDASPLRWRLVPTGTLVDLFDVALPPDGSTWVVGAQGTVLRHDGFGWSAPAIAGAPPTSSLRAIWAGADAVLIVGEAGTFLRWDGAALSSAIAEPPKVDGAPEDFTAVWATSASDAWLTTAQGGVFHFDGASLRESARLAGSLFAIGGSGDELWVAGEGVAAHLVDGAWQPVELPVLATWRAVGVDPGGVWIAGARTDGSSDSRGVCLNSAGGAFGATQMAAEPITDLFLSGGEERFTTSSGDVYRRVLNAGWKSLAAPSGARAIAGRSATDVVVVGEGGVVVRGTP